MCDYGCMKRDELLEARGRLEAFVKPLWPLLGRLERRRWGAFYVQGLLLEGGRKNAAAMARRYGGEVQALQQFVNQSPWDWQALRKVLAQQMMEVASSRSAWILDDTSFPKKGEHSVGVIRQYSGTLGKVANCQVAVSLNYATDEGCFPVDFDLYLPQLWLEDPGRRQKAHIPRDITFRTKWQIGLEMLARAREWGLPAGVVLADAAYGKVMEFRRALHEAGRHYVVGIPSDLGVWLGPVANNAPPYAGRGRPRTRDRGWPNTLKVAEVARRLPPEDWCEISWREGAKGPLKGRFAALLVQPARGQVRGKNAEPACWLLIEWPPEAEAPTKFWFSNLPDTTTLKELVYWAKVRWWIEQNYQQLKDELGLDHFEGRSWTGWQRHVTLTMIAFNFLVLEGIRAKKNFWVDPPTCPTRTSTFNHLNHGLLPMLPKADLF